MKLITKFFQKKKPQEAQAGITDMAKAIGPLLDRAVNDIFLEHRAVLLSEPITYIVPAVWGAAKNGDLTPEQHQINRKLLPVIQEVFDILQVNHLNSSQKFALGFLIRGLVISKVTFMIEALKNKLTAMEAKERESRLNQFKNVEPMGHA